jgi:hypothetical protein
LAIGFWLHLLRLLLFAIGSLLCFCFGFFCSVVKKCVSLHAEYVVQFAWICALSAGGVLDILAVAPVAPVAEPLCAGGVVLLLWLLGLAFSVADSVHVGGELSERVVDRRC